MKFAHVTVLSTSVDHEAWINEFTILQMIRHNDGTSLTVSSGPIIKSIQVAETIEEIVAQLS